MVEGTSGYSGAHYTLVSSVGLAGIQAPFMFESAMNRALFDAYVDQILIPTLKQGDILILDNLSAINSLILTIGWPPTASKSSFCRPIHPISIPSKSVGPKSKRPYAKPRPEPSRFWFKP